MLNIHLLGRMQVDNDHAALKLPNLRKTVPLWAYLLLHRGPVLRATLGHALWPDQSEASARANLRRHLHQLRSALPPTDPARDWLLLTPNHVQWNPQSDYWLDTAAFEEASSRDHSLQRAVELYQGELLPELDYDWVAVARTRLYDLYLNDLKQLVSVARQTADYSAALRYSRLLLVADPLDENTLRLAMTIHYEAGDRAGAIAEYERFSQLLRGELDITPMPETAALYRTILSNARLPGRAMAEQRPSLEETSPVAPTALPFIARERELARLRTQWAQAVRGEGSIILVGGEAGIGKTRLTAELARIAQAEGARLLYGYTTFPEPTPYQAIITALRTSAPLLATSAAGRMVLNALLPLLPELAVQLSELATLPRLEPERERDRLYMALRQCLAALAQPRPLLIILEDLHWAGAATISFLRYLMPALRHLPILLLATYREEETRRSHPLRELRQELASQSSGDQLLMLTRLPEMEAVQTLTSAVGLQSIDVALMTRFVQESEGNPLFLGELISNLLEALDAGQAIDAPAGEDTPLPVSIRRVVAERTARLATNTRMVAEIASVVGTAFNVELVREVAGLEERQVLVALDEMQDRAIIREGGGTNYDYTFTHHLIQESIYEGIEEGVRRRRHRRLAMVLEDLYPTRLTELAGDLARHFDRGAEPARAVAYYLSAATGAAQLYADEEAVALADRVLALTDDLRTRWRSLCISESIYQRQGNRSAQEATLAQMEVLAEELGDEELTFELLRRRIALYSMLGEREQQSLLVTTLTSRAQASGNQDWLALALTEQANLYLQLSQYQKVRETVTAALALYERAGNQRLQVECYCLLIDCVAHIGRFDEAQELIARAYSLSAADDRALLAKVLSAAAKAAVIQNRFIEARQLGQQLLDLCRAIQDKEGEATALLVIATSAASTWADEAFDYFEQARVLCAALGKRSGEAGALSNAGAFAVHVGRYEYGAALLREAATIYRDISNTRGQVVCLINIAIAQVRQGDPALAIASGKCGLEMATVMNSPYLESALLVTMGHAALELGQVAEAISYLEAALTRQSEIELGREMTISLSHLTLAYLSAGDLAAASQASARAIHLYETELKPQMIRPDYPQYIYWSAACLARFTGQHLLAARYLAEAQTLLAQELAIFSDEPARNAYLGIDFNRSLVLACKHGQWPITERVLAETELPGCPHCGAVDGIIKAGLNKTGSQRYRCPHCQRYFTTQRRAHGYTADIRLQALQLAREGKSSRTIARELGVSYRSILNWTRAANLPTQS